MADLANPGFLLAGVLLAAIPIAIHFLNRRRYRIVPWAAMEFLLRAMRQNRRRLRFESWLLLATRCLVLGLLGLALARPMGCNNNSLASMAGQRTGLHVLLIDNSCSMAYQADRPNAKTQLDQARILADQLIDRLSAGGESVAIITTARPARLVTASPLYDLQAAKSVVDHIRQSYAPADLPAALDAAAQVASAEVNQPSKSLYLIDDSTRSKWSGDAAASVAPRMKSLGAAYRLTHFDLAVADQWNDAVDSVRPTSPLVRLGFPDDFSTAIRGYGSGRPTSAQWSIDGRPLAGETALDPQPDAAPLTRTDVPLRVGGPHVITVSLTTPDKLPIDDSFSRVVNVASDLKVLIVEGERGSGPLDGSGAFLQLALSPPADVAGEPSRSASYLNASLISDLELPNHVLRDDAAVVLANVAQVSPDEADRMASYVRQGGALLLFMGDAVNPDAYNQILLPRGLMPGPLVKRVGDPSSQKSFQFDFKPNGDLDPMLRVFAGEEHSGLDTAQIFSYWQIDLPRNTTARRVLNYLPDPSAAADGGKGDPAVVASDLGAGRIVFFSTTASAKWTTLPAKPAYIPLMHELVAGAIRSSDTWMNLSCGDALTLPGTLQVTTPPTLLDPRQRPIAMLPPDADHPVYHSAPLTEPGVYRLSTGLATIPIAVNVPSGSADVRPVSADELRKAMGGVDCTLLGDALPASDATVVQPSNDFGWSVMMIVLVLLGGECLMAYRFGRYRRNGQAGA